MSPLRLAAARPAVVLVFHADHTLWVGEAPSLGSQPSMSAQVAKKLCTAP